MIVFATGNNDCRNVVCIVDLTDLVPHAVQESNFFFALSTVNNRSSDDRKGSIFCCRKFGRTNSHFFSNISDIDRNGGCGGFATAVGNGDFDRMLILFFEVQCSIISKG